MKRLVLTAIAALALSAAPAASTGGNLLCHISFDDESKPFKAEVGKDAFVRLGKNERVEGLNKTKWTNEGGDGGVTVPCDTSIAIPVPEALAKESGRPYSVLLKLKLHGMATHPVFNMPADKMDDTLISSTLYGRLSLRQHERDVMSRGGYGVVPQGKIFTLLLCFGADTTTAFIDEKQILSSAGLVEGKLAGSRADCSKAGGYFLLRGRAGDPWPADITFYDVKIYDGVVDPRDKFGVEKKTPAENAGGAENKNSPSSTTSPSPVETPTVNNPASPAGGKNGQTGGATSTNGGEGGASGNWLCRITFDDSANPLKTEGVADAFVRKGRKGTTERVSGMGDIKWTSAGGDGAVEIPKDWHIALPVPDKLAKEPGHPYSIEMRFRLSALDDWQPLLNMPADNETDSLVYVNQGDLRLAIKQHNKASGTAVYGESGFVVGKDHTLVLNFGANKTTAFLDGKQVFTRECTLAGSYADCSKAGGYFLIRGDENGEGGTVTFYEVKIYDGVIDSHDVFSVEKKTPAEGAEGAGNKNPPSNTTSPSPVATPTANNPTSPVATPTVNNPASPAGGKNGQTAEPSAEVQQTLTSFSEDNGLSAAEKNSKTDNQGDSGGMNQVRGGPGVMISRLDFETKDHPLRNLFSSPPVLLRDNKTNVIQNPNSYISVGVSIDDGAISLWKNHHLALPIPEILTKEPGHPYSISMKIWPIKTSSCKPLLNMPADNKTGALVYITPIGQIALKQHDKSSGSAIYGDRGFRFVIQTVLLQFDTNRTRIFLDGKEILSHEGPLAGSYADCSKAGGYFLLHGDKDGEDNSITFFDVAVYDGIVDPKKVFGFNLSEDVPLDVKPSGIKPGSGIVWRHRKNGGKRLDWDLPPDQYRILGEISMLRKWFRPSQASPDGGEQEFLACSQNRFDGYFRIEDWLAGKWKMTCGGYDDYMALAIDGKWIFKHPTSSEKVTLNWQATEGIHRFTVVFGDTWGEWGNCIESGMATPIMLDMNDGENTMIFEHFVNEFRVAKDNVDRLCRKSKTRPSAEFKETVGKFVADGGVDAAKKVPALKEYIETHLSEPCIELLIDLLEQITKEANDEETLKWVEEIRKKLADKKSGGVTLEGPGKQGETGGNEPPNVNPADNGNPPATPAQTDPGSTPATPTQTDPGNTPTTNPPAATNPTAGGGDGGKKTGATGGGGDEPQPGGGKKPEEKDEDPPQEEAEDRPLAGFIEEPWDETYKLLAPATFEEPEQKLPEGMIHVGCWRLSGKRIIYDVMKPIKQDDVNKPKNFTASPCSLSSSQRANAGYTLNKQGYHDKDLFEDVKGRVEWSGPPSQIDVYLENEDTFPHEATPFPRIQRIYYASEGNRVIRDEGGKRKMNGVEIDTGLNFSVGYLPKDWDFEKLIPKKGEWRHNSEVALRIYHDRQSNFSFNEGGVFSHIRSYQEELEGQPMSYSESGFVWFDLKEKRAFKQADEGDVNAYLYSAWVGNLACHVFYLYTYHDMRQEKKVEEEPPEGGYWRKTDVKIHKLENDDGHSSLLRRVYDVTETTQKKTLERLWKGANLKEETQVAEGITFSGTCAMAPLYISEGQAIEFPCRISVDRKWRSQEVYDASVGKYGVGTGDLSRNRYEYVELYKRYYGPATDSGNEPSWVRIDAPRDEDRYISLTADMDSIDTSQHAEKTFTIVPPTNPDSTPKFSIVFNGMGGETEWFYEWVAPGEKPADEPETEPPPEEPKEPEEEQLGEAAIKFAQNGMGLPANKDKFVRKSEDKKKNKVGLDEYRIPFLVMNMPTNREYTVKTTLRRIGATGENGVYLEADAITNEIPYSVVLEKDKKYGDKGIWEAVIKETGTYELPAGTAEGILLKIEAESGKKTDKDYVKISGTFPIYRIHLGLSLMLQANTIPCHWKMREESKYKLDKQDIAGDPEKDPDGKYVIEQEDYDVPMREGSFMLLLYDEDLEDFIRIPAIPTNTCVTATKVANDRYCKARDAEADHQTMVDALGIKVMSTGKKRQNGSHIVMVAPTKAVLDSPVRLVADLTVDTIFGGKTYTAKKSVLLHSQPLRDIETVEDEKKYLEQDEHIRKRLLRIMFKIESTCPDRLFSLRNMIERMLDGYDYRFGYDPHQVKTVMDMYVGFLEGTFEGANGTPYQVSRSDELKACYAFMQGLRDNTTFLGRMAMGVLTGGVSEHVFTTMTVLENMQKEIMTCKDVNKFGLLQATKIGAEEIGKQILIELAVQGALTGARTVAEKGLGLDVQQTLKNFGAKYRKAMDGADSWLKNNSKAYALGDKALQGCKNFLGSGTKAAANTIERTILSEEEAAKRAEQLLKKSRKNLTPDELADVAKYEKAMENGMNKVRNLQAAQQAMEKAKGTNKFKTAQEKYFESCNEVWTDKCALKKLNQINHEYAYKMRQEFNNYREGLLDKVQQEALGDIANKLNVSREELYIHNISKNKLANNTAPKGGKTSTAKGGKTSTAKGGKNSSSKGGKKNTAKGNEKTYTDGSKSPNDRDVTMMKKNAADRTKDLTIDQTLGEEALARRLWKRMHKNQEPPSMKEALEFMKGKDVSYVNPNGDASSYVFEHNLEGYEDLAGTLGIGKDGKYCESLLAKDLHNPAINAASIKYKGTEWWGPRAKAKYAEAAKLEALAQKYKGSAKQKLLDQALDLRYRAVGDTCEGIRQIVKQTEGIIIPRGNYRCGGNPLPAHLQELHALAKRVGTDVSPTEFVKALKSHNLDLTSWADTVSKYVNAKSLPAPTANMPNVLQPKAIKDALEREKEKREKGRR